MSFDKTTYAAVTWVQSPSTCDFIGRKTRGSSALTVEIPVSGVECLDECEELGVICCRSCT
eukprot:m.126828 g.126828  ORF g.126828 m.126828 type:complete len:61 (-) comp14529_c0_seq3:1370-1552(-)